MVSRYLSIGNACNLKCKFCYNDLIRNNKTFFEPLKDILIMVKQIRQDYKYLIIVGGEPFFHPKIEKILSYINKLKYNSIWIVTNGIKLSDINFAVLLYKYGVNNLEFSIHANNEKIEEKITGRSGENLKKREKGINNILLLNKKFNNKINLNSNTVVNLYNYKEIINIVRYISNLGIQNITVSFIYNLKGLSNTNKKIFIKYTKVVDVLNSSNDNFKDINLKIDWLPYCIHKKITKINYKIKEEENCKKNKSDYKNTDSKLKYKVKLNECNKCIVYGKLCNGIFKDYLDIFGESEFKAL